MRIGMVDNLPSGYPREGKKDSPDYACICRFADAFPQLERTSPVRSHRKRQGRASQSLSSVSGTGAATLKPWEAEETLLPLASLSLPCTLAR